FKEIVAIGWSNSVSGFWMFKVVKRLKSLKKPFRNLMYDQGNLHENVKKLRHELDEVQKALDIDPSNFDLQLGDANTAYFHKVVKSQVSRNRIDSITKMDGTFVDGDQVALAFVNHYTDFLGQPGLMSQLDYSDLFCKRLSDEEANSMIHEVSNKEIKDALLSLGDNKAPGPDGYSAAFFKEAWDIISIDVCKAIKEFFTNGVLLKELNHTIIALIPKVASPLRINDYRPISCCNVLFKCISKISSNRMKGSLSELFNLNQSAFVPRRRISDNILLTQELMHNYHLDRGPARCAFKVDI
ncbi:sodium/hydrogen exchanger 6, partial [Tanacetum coccineum]